MIKVYPNDVCQTDITKRYKNKRNTLSTLKRIHIQYTVTELPSVDEKEQIIPEAFPGPNIRFPRPAGQAGPACLGLLPPSSILLFILLWTPK